jgi:hypothetical protein
MPSCFLPGFSCFLSAGIVGEGVWGGDKIIYVKLKRALISYLSLFACPIAKHHIRPAAFFHIFYIPFLLNLRFFKKTPI